MIRRRLLLVAPFVLLPLLARLAVGPVADAFAATLAQAVPPLASAKAARIDDAATDERPAPVTKSAPRPKPVAKPTGDAGAAPIAKAQGTISVPAAAVAKAIADKKVGGRDAVDADGQPLGVRIHGVSAYGTGLQNGDVIVEVGGVRVPTTGALVDAGMKQIAAGATRLTGKIVRGDATFDVVLELPPRDK